MSMCVCGCVVTYSRQCVLYANFVNVYKLLHPILIRISLASFMEMHSVCAAVHLLHQQGGVAVNGAISSQ